MAKEKFGNGQDTCKICGQQLRDLRVLKINISHTLGSTLADVRYLIPLCDQHRGDGCLDIDIGWEPGFAPLDEMKDP